MLGSALPIDRNQAVTGNEWAFTSALRRTLQRQVQSDSGPLSLNNPLAFMLPGARTYWPRNAIDVAERWPIAKRTPGLLTAWSQV